MNKTEQVVFDNNLELLQELRRGVDPDVLEDIGIHPFYIAKAAVGAGVEFSPDHSKRPNHQSAWSRARKDVSDAASENKPFPHGNAGREDYDR